MPEKLEVIREGAVWDSFLAANGAHVLQTYAWGELKARFGWQVERVALRRDGDIAAAAQILYKRLAPALTVAYIPRGPSVGNPSEFQLFLGLVKAHARKRGAFLLKIEPDAAAGYAGEDALLEAGACKTDETIQPPNTIHIDLAAPLDTILGRMKSKWRYNIRLAERKGVVVREGTVADFGRFYELMRVTGERDAFAIHDKEYYQTAFELLDEPDDVRLFIAEYDSQPLAMIFVTAFKDEAIYLYGASGNAERNRMPNHALHWAAIRWAKERGCTRYDLWGIPETIQVSGEEDASLPSSLYQFKQGFGGEVVHYTGAWDIVFNPALYRVYKFARRLRKDGVV